MLGVLLFFSLPTYFYLYWRLVESPLEAVILALPLLLILSFPYKKFHELQLHLIFTSLGILTYLVFASLLKDFISLTSDFTLSRIWVILFSLLVFIAGSLYAMWGPKIKKILITVPNLHPSLDGFKIAQISDLHIGPTISASYVEKVVRKTNALNAQMIALTGDIGDGPVKTYRSAIQPLLNLKSELGTFYVPGNHEYYWNVNEWLGVMNNVGMINLVNRGKTILKNGARVYVGGIPDQIATIKADLNLVYEAGADCDYKILLSHRPGVAEEASKTGFDLQLSGHTHGGQFFPWTLVVRMVHRYFRGLSQVGNMRIYVSPGTGSWGPFLRVGTTAEITLIELKVKDILRPTALSI